MAADGSPVFCSCSGCRKMAADGRIVLCVHALGVKTWRRTEAPCSPCCQSLVMADLEDPGAAPYGNFPNYYTFHPPENRISLLPPGHLLELLDRQGAAEKPLLALDVGCNTGELSVALYNHLLQGMGSSAARQDVHLLCCDIDPDLISRAKTGNPFPDSITFSSLDIMHPSSLDILQNFLDKFGHTKFDVGFCMSITMWIHLNHGDHGLVEFLKKLTTLCDYLLVEPQPWKCYRSAARRLRKLGRQDFDHFHTLSIRGDMTEQIINILARHCGSELLHRFGNTSWDRSLLLFKTKSTKLLG